MLMRSGEPPAPVTLPLLCALGQHRTDELARWNAGYYFARCTRCRRDLVRTAFTRWQIPRGFRVVWQGDGPQAHGGEAERYVAPATQVEFPLRDDPHTAFPAGSTGAQIVGDLSARHENAMDADQEASNHADLRDVGVAVDAPEEGVADTPSWFDRDRSVDDDVRFDADDRLADYSPPEPEQVPEGEEAENGPDGGISDAELEPRVQPPPPVSSKYSVVPDFMDEGPAGVGWEVVSGHVVPHAGAAQPTPQVPADVPRDVPSGLFSQIWQDLVRRRAQRSGEQGREWLRGRWARPRHATLEGFSEPTAPEAVVPAATAFAESATTHRLDEVPVADAKPHIAISAEHSGVDDVPSNGVFTSAIPPHPVTSRAVRDTLLQHGPLAAAFVFGGLVFAAAVVDGRNSPPLIVYRDAPATAPARAAVLPPVTRQNAARGTPVESDVAYVTAGLLKCRAAPSKEADTVRRLSRGAQLRVLGSSPGWIGVAHQGRQCWVSEQHVSSTKPI